MNKHKFCLSLIAASILAVSSTAQATASSQDYLNLGGAMRANYKYIDYDELNSEKSGEFSFDVFIAKVSAKNGDFGLEAEYRWNADDHFITKGYGYYDINDNQQLQVGITDVPFGNPYYISNSWWLSIAYYLGFEADVDTGIKWVYQNEGWNTDVAFFKSAEFGPSKAMRFAADLYSGTTDLGDVYRNEEANQYNLRQTYTWSYDGGRVTLGGSGQYGEIQSTDDEGNIEMGDRYALAVHADALYMGWNLQLQAMEYEYSPEIGSENGAIAVAVSGGAYEIALKGQMYALNISKSIPTSFGVVKIYNDYNIMTPDMDSDEFDNSYQNVTGTSISAGPIFAMIDFVVGKNMAYSTANDYHIGLQHSGDDWDKRFNFNIGYYF